MSDLDRAREILRSGDHTLVLCRGDEIYTSHERGVKPLVVRAERGESLRGFCAADKVVGRATAFLYILLDARAVYAQVISRTALELLKEHGVETEYGELVENVINRRGDGICPFEAAVLDISDTDAAYDAILQKMREMNIYYEK